MSYLIRTYLPKEPVHPMMRALDRMTAVFPGITIHSMCVGSWVNSKGEHVQEGVLVVELIVEHESDVEACEAILLEYKGEATQESVLYTVQEVKPNYL